MLSVASKVRQVIEPIRQHQDAKLDATDISTRTLLRDLTALMSKDASTNIALYGAQAANDKEKESISWLYWKACKSDSDRIAAKATRLDALNDRIYLELCNIDLDSHAPQEIKFRVVRNGEDIEVGLKVVGDNISMHVGFLFATLEGCNFSQLKDKFGDRLNDSTKKLSQPAHRLAWLEIGGLSENSIDECRMTEKSEYARFVTIGSQSERTTDTGTVVMSDDNLFAATVVHGGEDKEKIAAEDPIFTLPTYSAAVTAAVMHVVGHGILAHDLTSDQLNFFLFETIKLSLKKASVFAEPHQWPAFRTVIFYKQDDQYKKFECSLENNKFTVEVSNAVPGNDPALIAQNELLLAPGRNANEPNALHVSLNVAQCILGWDDFGQFSVLREVQSLTRKHTYENFSYVLVPKQEQRKENVLEWAYGDMFGFKTQKLNWAILDLVAKEKELLTAHADPLSKEEIIRLKREVHRLQKTVETVNKKWHEAIAKLMQELKSWEDRLVLVKKSLIELKKMDKQDEKLIISKSAEEKRIGNVISTLHKNRRAFKVQQEEIQDLLKTKNDLEDALIRQGLMQRENPSTQKYREVPVWLQQNEVEEI